MPQLCSYPIYSPLPTIRLGACYPHRESDSPYLAIPMSSSSRTDSPSIDNFTAIFASAESEYQRVTGNRLDTHPFAAQLRSCDSPEDVSKIFRTQVHALRNFRQGDEKLMKWLDPTVNILFIFSSTVAEGIGLVSRIIHSHIIILQHLFLSRSRPRE